MWGINHEDDSLFACKEYCFPFHEELGVEKVGLCLNPRYPQFGASLDGMVYCECCGRGYIEVKCPFFIKKYANCVMFVDKCHLYYYQMHMKLALAQVKFCDFVIWSPLEFFHERVFFDEDFWTVESQKAVEFHNKVIMPELLGIYFTKDKVSGDTWCIQCGNYLWNKFSNFKTN
jgi:hypothetical protein